MEFLKRLLVYILMVIVFILIIGLIFYIVKKFSYRKKNNNKRTKTKEDTLENITEETSYGSIISNIINNKELWVFEDRALKLSHVEKIKLEIQNGVNKLELNNKKNNDNENNSDKKELKELRRLLKVTESQRSIDSYLFDRMFEFIFVILAVFGLSTEFFAELLGVILSTEFSFIIANISELFGWMLASLLFILFIIDNLRIHAYPREKYISIEIAIEELINDLEE